VRTVAPWPESTDRLVLAVQLGGDGHMHHAPHVRPPEFSDPVQLNIDAAYLDVIGARCGIGNNTVRFKYALPPGHPETHDSWLPEE